MATYWMKYRRLRRTGKETIGEHELDFEAVSDTEAKRRASQAIIDFQEKAHVDVSYHLSRITREIYRAQ